MYNSILLDTNKKQNNLKPRFLFTDNPFFIGCTVNAILSKPRNVREMSFRSKGSKKQIKHS